MTCFVDINQPFFLSDLETETATWPLWAPLPLNQQGNMGITTLARRTDPDYQREIGLLLYITGKEEHVCNTGDALEYLLVWYVW